MCCKYIDECPHHFTIGNNLPHLPWLDVAAFAQGAHWQYIPVVFQVHYLDCMYIFFGAPSAYNAVYNRMYSKIWFLILNRQNQILQLKWMITYANSSSESSLRFFLSSSINKIHLHKPLSLTDISETKISITAWISIYLLIKHIITHAYPKVPTTAKSFV